jgi:hypothetical protein
MVNIVRLLADQGLTKGSHDLLLIVGMNTVKKDANFNRILPQIQVKYLVHLTRPGIFSFLQVPIPFSHIDESLPLEQAAPTQSILFFLFWLGSVAWLPSMIISCRAMIFETQGQDEEIKQYTFGAQGNR